MTSYIQSGRNYLYKMKPHENFSLENIEGEIWKPVIGFDNYEVSNFGRIKIIKSKLLRIKVPKIKKLRPDKNGYLKLNVWKGGVGFYRSAHRLLMAAFVGESELLVDHKDGNVTNNHIDNLRYCNNRENHSFDNVKLPRPKTSKYVGVHWRKDCKKWRAAIVVNGYEEKLGTFKTEEEAYISYQKRLSEVNGK